jgi:hypothetical protein
MPTALDNGQRSPRKLLADVVRSARRRAQAAVARGRPSASVPIPPASCARGDAPEFRPRPRCQRLREPHRQRRETSQALHLPRSSLRSKRRGRQQQRAPTTGPPPNRQRPQRRRESDTPANRSIGPPPPFRNPPAPPRLARHASLPGVRFDPKNKRAARPAIPVAPMSAVRTNTGVAGSPPHRDSSCCAGRIVAEPVSPFTPEQPGTPHWRMPK